MNYVIFVKIVDSVKKMLQNKRNGLFFESSLFLEEIEELPICPQLHKQVDTFLVAENGVHRKDVAVRDKRLDLKFLDEHINQLLSSSGRVRIAIFFPEHFQSSNEASLLVAK